MIKPITIQPPQANTAGIVTLNNWTMMPDGRTYLYIWSPRWEVLTDKEFPVEGFHSSEKWQAVAIAGNEPVLIVPGCQVKALALCRKPVYSVGQVYFIEDKA